MIYSAKARHVLTEADLVLTYSTNTFQFAEYFSDAPIYYPWFVRLTRCAGKGGLLKAPAAMPRSVLFLTLVAAVLVSGCSSLFQQNIAPDASALFRPGEGLILGSVTAAYAERYYETLVFSFRSIGDGGKTTGLITSASSVSARLVQWGIPTCDKDGLAEQCGRMFAVNLPAGDYEFHSVNEMRAGATIFEMPPLRFSVAEGRASYLGNLHTTFCQGLVRRTRGAILGGQLVILDESQRDLALLKAQYQQLTGADIDKMLLPNLGWRWREPYEPYDWGTCGSGQEGGGQDGPE